MTLFPSLRLVLILDNAAIHYAVKIGELCKRVGVNVKCLPFYSPNISLIELIFSVLKL